MPAPIASRPPFVKPWEEPTISSPYVYENKMNKINHGLYFYRKHFLFFVVSENQSAQPIMSPSLKFVFAL